MRSIRSAVLALGCWWLAGAQAQEPEPPPGPDLDFLEYLGAWAEEDDEWLVIEAWQDVAVEPEQDPDASEKEKEGDDEGE